MPFAAHVIIHYQCR